MPSPDPKPMQCPVTNSPCIAEACRKAKQCKGKWAETTATSQTGSNK